MIYLLLGPEEGEKNDWLENEKAKLKAQYPDIEITTFFGGDEDGSELSRTLSQSSLFSSFRLIVFKHYENVKKSDEVAKVIAEFAKDNPADAELILLTTETSTASFPKEVIDQTKDTTFKFWELDDNKKRNWIRTYAKKEGFLITNPAIEEILSSVDNNTAEMKNLVSSIVLFLRLSKDNKNTIDIEDIETYSSRTKGENGYTLFRAIAECNLEKSLLIVNSILLSDIRDAIPAFTVLSNQFRLLEACLEMKESNIPDREIFKSVSYVSTSSSSKRSVGVFFKDQDTFRKAMANYSLLNARNIILYIGEKDSEIKSASTEMTKLSFEKAIYDIIINKGEKTEIEFDSESL